MDEEKVEMQEGLKPVPGIPSNFGQGTTIRQLDENGKIIDVRTSGAPLDTRNVKTPQEYNNPARVGDYYYAPNKTLQVWENSPTDLLQKYKIGIGGSGMTSQEAVANSVSLTGIGGGAAVGAAIGSIVPFIGTAIGGVIGALNSYNSAAEEALNNWKKENIKYDSAVEFYRDENGKLKYKLDYEKMGTGGFRSGEGVKEAQNRKTEVKLGNDGRLKITVSPIFASTARFQEIAKWISENYAGLNKNTENLDNILNEIKEGIDGEARDFITNMKLYADYSNRFVDATPEAIVSAYMTEAAGYADPEKMGDFSMSIINKDGKIEQTTAKDFFDSVLAMGKDDRSRLVERLTKLIESDDENIGDNEKAIAYGEIKALYAVSKNPEEYKDSKYSRMMDADWIVSLISHFRPLGLNTGDVLKFVSGGHFMNTSQEYLNQDDFASFVGVVGSVGAGFGLWKGGTSLIEKGLKLLPGTSQLFNASLEGQEGGALAFFAQATGKTKDVVKAASASALFKTLKVGIFDAALVGTKTLVSGTDFLSEFGKDFARDAVLELVFSYYDMVQFQKAVNDNTVYVYKDPKTGEIKTLPFYEEEVFVDNSFTEDGGRGTAKYEPVGAANIQKTRSGEDVGIVVSERGTTYYYNGTAVTVSPSGEPQKMLVSPEGETDGVPAFKTGVAPANKTNVKTQEGVDLSEALKRAGLPPDTPVFEMSATDAQSAIVAGKVAKADATKTGLAINKNLFNKNAALDTVNEMALAKTGDRTAWQNRMESFVSVTDNANREKNRIANSYYAPSKKAFNDYTMALGRISLKGYSKKKEGNYLKALRALEVASYLDKTKPKTDPRNYTEEALAKYGEAIAKVPADKAEMLQAFHELRKKRNDAIKNAARKSGKIDVKKLDKITDSEIQSEIGWVPQWGKRQTYRGLLDQFYGVTPQRNIYKEWDVDGGWVDLDDLEDPLVADDRFFNFVATNMGLNDMMESAVGALEDAGLLVDNTPTSATIRKKKLESVKNKDQIIDKMTEMTEAKKKEVKEKVPSQKEYKKWAVGLYEKYGIDGAIENAVDPEPLTQENWDKKWRTLGPATRKVIREELAKTALQTGYGIKSTRARLNALMPGVDVLDWSLLGRDHTNGLVPGGLYAKRNNPVKAYIMSVDDLAKLAGYNLDETLPDMGNLIEKNINTEGAVPVIPVHVNQGDNGPSVWLKMRWGHNGDGDADWAEYLKKLKERGIEKIPVAINDARGKDFNSVFYQVRNSGIAQKGLDNVVKEIDRCIATGDDPEFSIRDLSAAMHVPGMSGGKLRQRIRRSLPSSSEEGVSHIADNDLNVLLIDANNYDWSKDEELNAFADNIDNIVKNKLGYIPQDITTELGQVFTEEGFIPLYHNQNDDFGSIEYNKKEAVPTTREGKLYDQDGAGDAYWLAPNATYTDDYGKNKLIGTIPVKYFLSDKAKNEVVEGLRNELREIENKAFKLVEKEFNKKVKKIESAASSDVIEGNARTIDDFADSHGLREAAYDVDLRRLYGDAPYYHDDSNLLYRAEWKARNDEGRISFDVRFVPIKKYYITPLTRKKLLEKGLSLLTKKDADRHKEILDMVNDSNYSGKAVKSYRALAELTKKPVIDISDDGFAAGTAFFYYKGIDPKFDEELGKELALQAQSESLKPQWTEDRIANLMEEFYDGISLIELIESVTGSPDIASDISIELSEILENGDKREADEYYIKNIHDPLKAKRTPGILEVADTIWYNNSSSDLSDYVFKYWNPGTGYPTISDEDTIKFLEEMGEKPLAPEGAPEVDKNQLTLYDSIKRTMNNVPNNPEIKQPKRVSFMDYLAGIEADPESENRINNAIRGAAADNLVKQVSSLLYEASAYNNLTGYSFDTKSYLNTGMIPNLNEIIPSGDKSLAAAAINEGILDVAPYRSQSEVLKSQLDVVAQEWREWAEKNIKAGRATSKELKKFAEDNELNLPKDKRPLPSKVKSALWDIVENKKTLPKIDGLFEEFKKDLLEDINLDKASEDEDINKPGVGEEIEEDAIELDGLDALSKAFGVDVRNIIEQAKLSRDDVKKTFYKALDNTALFQSANKDKKELVDLIAAEINGTTTDAYEMGAATTAAGLGGKYPITWYRHGKPYTRFITCRNKEEQLLAEEITSIFNDKQLIKQPGIVSRIAAAVANDFRLLTTGLDPTRAPLNVIRDTGRGEVAAGGESFISPGKLFKEVIELGDYTPEEKRKLSQALDNVAKMVSGETYNAAYRNPRSAKVQATKEYLKKTGANPLKRFMYTATHTPSAILEAPADFFEGMTRRRLAKSAAVVKLRQLQKEGASFKEQLEGMVDAAYFAGREYTANFQRKGRVIGATSKYVAYQSSSYAGLDSLKRAYINNPAGVTRNFAMFLILYLILLADTLSNEKTRKSYYRLSDYDRGNTMVISIDENTVLTIPLDQEIASLLYPYRRFVETLNGVDPVSFFELFWGTITEPMPMDLSGFSEGGSFNIARGLEKLTAQNMPNLITPIQEAATGYDLYYGSDISVSDETLKDQGIYAPEPGDYTTKSKDSAILRNVANVLGIKQWQLQTMVEGYGGNVGSYTLNILDKLSGATEEQQGGKDFVNAIFKSFVATDQDAASNTFYEGIRTLQVEKQKVVRQIARYNEDMKTASGQALVDLQMKVQKAKDDFAVKVGDYVDKYVSAYEITGGLPKSKAMQIYYLFRFDDDDTVYEYGSPEEYYNNQAKQKLKNQATALSAPILDKYYNNRIGNFYQDSEGVWRRYSSGGLQAMKNSVFGEGEEHMVNLLNILEGKDSGLKTLRSKVKKARDVAYNSGDFTTRDKIGYEFDLKVIDALAPYIDKYGAENVLASSDVLDYLSDWFFVPSDFKTTKKGKYVSLGNSGSTDEAFVRPYIKYVFGLPTNYYSYSETTLTNPELGTFGR